MLYFVELDLTHHAWRDRLNTYLNDANNHGDVLTATLPVGMQQVTYVLIFERADD